MILYMDYTNSRSQNILRYLGIFACIDMHYFCSLISFSILFRNAVFLVSILEMRHYKLLMNSCIRYLFGLNYSILSVFS